MVTYMKNVVKVRLLKLTGVQSGYAFDDASEAHFHRNLLSVGYKNAVSSRRAAWRTLSDIQESEDYKKGKQSDNKNI